jgi:rubrerythrin
MVRKWMDKHEGDEDAAFNKQTFCHDVGVPEEQWDRHKQCIDKVARHYLRYKEYRKKMEGVHPETKVEGNPYQRELVFISDYHTEYGWWPLIWDYTSKSYFCPNLQEREQNIQEKALKHIKGFMSQMYEAEVTEATLSIAGGDNIDRLKDAAHFKNILLDDAKHCRSCGYPLQDDWLTCPSCGLPQNRTK